VGLLTGWSSETARTFFVDGAPPSTPPPVEPWWTTDLDGARVSEHAHAERAAQQAALEALASFLAYGTEPVAELPVVPWWADEDDLSAERAHENLLRHLAARSLPDVFWISPEATFPPPETPPNLGRFIDFGDSAPPIIGPADFAFGTTETLGLPTVPDLGRFTDFAEPTLAITGHGDVFWLSPEEGLAPPPVPDLGQFADFAKTSAPQRLPEDFAFGEVAEPFERDGDVGRFIDFGQITPVRIILEDLWAGRLGDAPGERDGDVGRFTEFAESWAEEIRRRLTLEQATHLLAVLGEPTTAPDVAPFWPELDLLKTSAPIAPDLPLAMWVPIEIAPAVSVNWVVAYGRLALKWIHGAPSAKWAMSQPRTKWKIGGPEA